jgi:predicted kinase
MGESGDFPITFKNFANKLTEAMANARLFIVCGLPGSGKTTHAKRLESKFNAIRFCPDEWLADLSLDNDDELRRGRIEALQWRLAQTLLTHGIPVIIEWGTWARSERDTLRLGARGIGASVELHYLSASVDVLYERIRQRGAEDPPIQANDMVQWASVFQEPTPEELALFDPPL